MDWVQADRIGCKQDVRESAIDASESCVECGVVRGADRIHGLGASRSRPRMYCTIVKEKIIYQ
jgi:hypothetical protein